MPQRFLDLLHARSGLICAVGAGGKKTTLYRLARLHPGKVALTSTVFIPPFPKDLEVFVVRESSERLLSAIRQAATTHRRLAYTGTLTKRGRFEGVAPAQVQAIHELANFDVTLVKADGARTRLIKAPAEDEPQLPERTATVLLIVSAQAINKRLSERIAHRIEQIQQVSEAEPGQPLTPLHVARLLASPRGLLKHVGDAHVVPVINMVDDEDTKSLARKAAEEALRLTKRFDRIVLTSMRRVNPVVDVVQR